MQSLLFFDEAESNAVTYVRAAPDSSNSNDSSSRAQLLQITTTTGSSGSGGSSPPPPSAAVSFLANGGSSSGSAATAAAAAVAPDARYSYRSFECSGSLAVAELDAVVVWWLDDSTSSSNSNHHHHSNNNSNSSSSGGGYSGRIGAGPGPGPGRVLLHLLAVNNGDSAARTHCAQSRRLSVELPVSSAAELLTCGVSSLARGGHCISVAWLSTAAVPGCLRVTVQRDSDSSGGVLLMTPEGQAIVGDPVRALLSSSTAAAAAAAGGGVVGPHASACVLAAVPTVDASGVWEPYDYLQDDFHRRPNPATQPTPAQTAIAALFVATDGARVWRVRLLESGATAAAAMRDSPQREQLGLLCAQLNAAAAALPTTDEAAALRRHPLFSDLSNLQRIPKHRGEGAAAGGGAESAQQQRQGWLARFLGGRGGDASSSSSPAAPRRRFLAVCAVQHTPYVAVLRWNGLIELYDADLSPVEHFPSCYIAPQEVAPCGLFQGGAPTGDAAASASSVGVQQWATWSREQNAVHVVVSIGALEGRRCVWARLPAVDRSSDEKVVLRCARGVVPPASGSAPIACAVDARERLALLWDIGVEEDAHLLAARSVSSLFNPATAPVAAALQILSGQRGVEGAWVSRGAQTFLCHGAPRLRAVLAVDADIALVEAVAGHSHRAYVLRPTADGGADDPQQRQQRGATSSAVATLVETARVDVAEGVEAGGSPYAAAAAAVQMQKGPAAAGPLRAPRLIPTIDSASSFAVAPLSQQQRAGGDGLRLFWDGCDALRCCVRGADLLSALLRDALTSPFSGQRLAPALGGILHEAYLAGYAPELEEDDNDDDDADEEEGEGGEGIRSGGGGGALSSAIYAAIAEAYSSGGGGVGEGRRGQQPAAFCSFSRHYILHSVSARLLQRVAFLAVSLVGAHCHLGHEDNCNSSSEGAPPSAVSSPLPGGAEGVLCVRPLVQELQLLAAAFHAAQIAGPELSRFAPAGQHYASGDDIVEAILSRFSYAHWAAAQRDHNNSLSSSHAGTSAPPVALFVAEVARALSRCHTPRTVKASAAWSGQLLHHFPLLAHYRLLVDIDAGRTTHSTQQLDMCMKVVRSVAGLADSAAAPNSSSQQHREGQGGGSTGAWLCALPARVLVDYGLLVADAAGCTLLASLLVPGTPGHHELLSWAVARPSLAPKLYAIGILRRLVPSRNSSYAPSLLSRATGAMGASSPSVSASGVATAQQQPQQPRRAAVSISAVQHYYLTELMNVRASVAAMCGNTAAGASPAAGAGEEDEEAAAAAAPSAAAPSFALLRAALEELLIDSLLYVAEGAVAETDYSACRHALESAMVAAEELDVLYAYVEPFHAVLAAMVETACASPRAMDALVATSGSAGAAVCLDELLVAKWYNVIARLPTKSASPATEALRYRAVMGLYRFLMCRHAYAQCGRVMTDLATLLRCSPLRNPAAAADANAALSGGSATISVGELAALALAAVEMIAPDAPVALHSDAAADADGDWNSCGGGGASISAAAPSARQHPRGHRGAAVSGSPLSAGFAWRALRGSGGASPTAMGGIGAGGAALRLLSRDDLPLLRRRVYQAHCERQLQRRGRGLDCTDLWVEDAPAAEFSRAVHRLTAALEEAALWEEAYRFADLAGADSVAVLQHWAIHLCRRTRSLSTEEEEEGMRCTTTTTTTSSSRRGGGFGRDAEREEIAEEWAALIRYCAEQSSLSCQFRGFSRVVHAALVADYTCTPQELLDAHRSADPYTAAATLLRVFTALRDGAEATSMHRRRDGAEEAADDGEEEEEAAAPAYHRGGQLTCWLAWADAAVLCAAVLSSASPAAAAAGGGGPSGGFDVFTAGVVDPLVRYGQEGMAGAAAEAQRLVESRHGARLEAIAAQVTQSLARH